MFKFRRNKTSFVTVRAEDLQVADRFVYDNASLEVLDAIQGERKIVVRLGSPAPEYRCETRQVELWNELLITVIR
jgi:hypothetical protein